MRLAESFFYCAVAASFLNLQFLLPVTPLLASTTGALPLAGWVTASLMGMTVAMQLGMPTLSRRMGTVGMVFIGSLLMGLPSLAYLGHPAAATILVASALRGVGFGLVSVMSTAVIINMASEGGRARAIGRFGLLTGMIAAVAPALGVRMYDSGNGALLFCLSGALPVVGLLVLPYRYLRSVGGSLRAPRVLPLFRAGSVARPTLVFALAAVGYGALVSYLPQSFAGAAVLLLLLFGITQAVCRALAGRVPSDQIQRYGLLAAVPVALCGLLLLWWATRAKNIPLAYAGLLLLGIGLGTLTTASLVAVAVRGRDRTHIGPAVLWNVAFDAGIAMGGLVFSLVAHGNSSSSVYAICAALLLAGAVLAVQDGRRQPLTV